MKKAKEFQYFKKALTTNRRLAAMAGDVFN
jgi:hypothetical protein